MQVINNESNAAPVTINAASAAKRTRADIAAQAQERKQERELLRGTENYITRVRIFTGNAGTLSQLWKNTRAVQSEKARAAIENAKFADFRAYLCARVKNSESKENWNRCTYYAAQFFEKYIKSAAQNKESADYTAARNYLVATRAELQNIESAEL